MESVEFKGKVQLQRDAASLGEGGLYCNKFESQGTCLQRVIKFKVKSGFRGKQASFSVRVKQVFADAKSQQSQLVLPGELSALKN